MSRITTVEKDTEVRADAVGLDVPRTAGKIRVTLFKKGRGSAVWWVDYYSGAVISGPAA